MRASPEFRRLEAVRNSIKALAEAYGTGSVPATNDVVAQPTPKPPIPTWRGGSRPSSVASNVVKIAEEAMRTTGKRLNSREVYELVVQHGVVVDGKKPSSVVSSILSHRELFVNTYDDRGSGYGLREWSDPVAHKENEPSSSHAVGSDAADVGAHNTPSASGTSNNTPGG